MLGQFGECMEKGFRFGVVHSGCRFVEKQEARFGGQSPRDLDAPLVPVAEVAAQFIALFSQAELRHQGLCLLPGSGQAVALGERGGLDVFEYRHRIEQTHDLKRAADACKRDGTGAEARDRPAVGGDRATGELHLASDGVDECRLAGAVRANQAEDFAGVDAERYLVECAKAGEFNRDIRDRETRFRHGISES